MAHRSWYPRLLGALTLGYGAYTTARPGSLVRTARLETGPPPLSPSGRALGAVIGARDLLSGLSMLVAKKGVPLECAIIARVVLDLSDAATFGRTVPASRRAAVIAVAGGWGLLCAISLPAGRGR